MSTAREQWEERAEYDIETAKAMMKSKRYLYVVFCCQQAIEKMLKAIIAERTQDMPPKIHNLEKLARLANVDTDDQQQSLLLDLSNYYVQSRYPEDVTKLAVSLNQSSAQKALNQSKEMLEWLRSM